MRKYAGLSTWWDWHCERLGVDADRAKLLFLMAFMIVCILICGYVEGTVPVECR